MSSASSSNKISSPKSSNQEKTVVFTYGRFQPPHIGHQLLINYINDKASELHAKPYVIVTSSCTSKWFSSLTYKKQQKANTFANCKDINDNPLTMKQKLKYLRKMFPTTKFIQADKYDINLFNVLGHIRDKGYTKFIGLFGSDRAPGFKKMFKDNAERLQEKLAADPNFEQRPFNIEIQAVGDKRVDAADDITGISSTKMREKAVENTDTSQQYFIDHSRIGNMTPEDSLEMMKEVRKALWKDIKEEPEEEQEEVEKPKRKSKKKETAKEDNTEKPEPRRSSRLKNPTEGGYIPPKVIHTPRPKHYKFREDEIYLST